MNASQLNSILQKENEQYNLTYKLDTLGPYKSVFYKENLFFRDDICARGNSLFPFKTRRFNNSEIFIDNSDILIACGVRGNLGGEKGNILDIIDIPTGRKSRIYPESVSLIYHDKEVLYIYYSKSTKFYEVQVSLSSFEIISESPHSEIHAFFKLLYYPLENTYKRIKLKSRDGKKYFEIQNLIITKNQDNWRFPIHIPFSTETETRNFLPNELRLTDIYRTDYEVLDILYPDSKKIRTHHQHPKEDFNKDKSILPPSNQCYRHSLQFMDREKTKKQLYYNLGQITGYLLIMTIISIGIYGLSWIEIFKYGINFSEIQKLFKTENTFGLTLFFILIIFIAILEFFLIKEFIINIKNILKLRKGVLNIEVFHHEFTQHHTENDTLYYY